MTEHLAHRSGGACAGEGQAGRHMPLERKGLKGVRRRTSINGNKSLVYQWCFVPLHYF